MTIAKYRPTLTMDEITCIIDALEALETQTVSSMSALRNLKMFKFKADMGVNGPASITTGKKPGPTSAIDILKADAAEDYDKQRKEMPYGQAVIAAKMYTDLGQPVPQDIQSIIDLGDIANDSDN